MAHNRPIQVAVALGEIGPGARRAVPALIGLMKDRLRTCQAVTLAIGQISGPDARAAVPVLKELLRAQNEPVRIRATQTLWRIDRHAEVVLPLLVELFQPEAHIAR